MDLPADYSNLCLQRLFSFGFFRRGSSRDELQNAHFASIAAAFAQLDDAGVTALTAGVSRSDFVKQLFDSVFVVHTGSSETAAVKSSLFAEGDHAFCHTAGSFGLDQTTAMVIAFIVTAVWWAVFTLPLLRPVISIMFIMNVGHIFSTDFGLFYQVTRDSGSIINVTQTLDVYVYKALMQSNNYNYSAAASLLQNTLGCILLIVANLVVKKIDPESGMF